MFFVTNPHAVKHTRMFTFLWSSYKHTDMYACTHGCTHTHTHM